LLWLAFEAMDWDALGIAKPSRLLIWKRRVPRIRPVCALRGHRIEHKSLVMGVSLISPLDPEPQQPAHRSVLMQCACGGRYEVVSGSDPYADQSAKRRVIR
jgi:hypothetical protein